MTKTTVNLFFTLLLFSLSGLNSLPAKDSTGDSVNDQTKQTRTSGNGQFEVTIESHLKPLKLGRMHAWTATVNNAEGNPVTNATFKVGGGMPIHNHGFPTQPEMTKQLEPGVYLIEGFKFSMNGPWIILLDVSAGDKTDTVAFDIDM